MGVSLGSGVVAGVAAATISQPADGLLSKVNKKGAGGEGSMMVRLGRIAADWDCKVVHRRIVCPVASRRTHHSWSVRHRRCLYDVGRRFAIPLSRPCQALRYWRVPCVIFLDSEC